MKTYLSLESFNGFLNPSIH